MNENAIPLIGRSRKKIKKVIGLVKDRLRGKIMIKFVGLRAKTYSYLIDEGREDEKQIKQKSMSQNGDLNLKVIKTV